MSASISLSSRFAFMPDLRMRTLGPLCAVVLAAQVTLRLGIPSETWIASDIAVRLWLVIGLLVLARRAARGLVEASTLIVLAGCAVAAGAFTAHAVPLAAADCCMIGGCVLARRSSTARMSPRRRMMGYGALAAGIAVAWLLTNISLGSATLPLDAILLLGGAGALLVLLQPAGPATSHEARTTLVGAIAHYAENPLTAYALCADKAYFSSANGHGGVAFRVCAGVALAAGEPVGPPEERLMLTAEYAEFCRTHGWIPAFYQVLDSGVDTYRAAGLQALKIGEEAMIDLPSFTLSGKRIANVRHCVTHVERAGLRAEFYPHGVEDEATLSGLAAVSAAWLGARSGRGEMGFSMGSFTRDGMRTACVALARDTSGRVCAFITFRPVGSGGMVLDLMRRDSTDPSGTMDFLIARALEGLCAAGFAFASLSLAPLAGVAEDGRHPRVERLLSMLYERGNSLYRYKSLYNFKRKFAPRWQARYLLYPRGVWNLLRVGFAVALVHTPQVLHRPNPRALFTALRAAIRRALDWRQGLLPDHLVANLRMMTLATLAFAVPEVVGACRLFDGHGVAHAYAALALGLALGDAGGAVAMARRLDIGRRLLTLAALGFFVKSVWAFAAGYDGGLVAWSTMIVLAPIEIWMVWFLLQPEVRAHFSPEVAVWARAS